MDYFTSDLHIGHNKEFLWKPRGFSSIEEHDSTIIDIWNKTVSPEDTVYILGDLCMSSNEKEWNKVYKVLNGHIKFIRGNHDTDNKILRYINEYKMEDLGITFIYRYSKRKRFYLSHYPTLVGNFQEEKFFWNLSGHTHDKNIFTYGKSCVYNVAWDAHNKPVSIEQIIKDIYNFKQGVKNEN